MVILDKPYVSALLENTILESGLPVLRNKAAEKLNLTRKLYYITEKEFIHRVKTTGNYLIYCNSENPINWIAENLSFTDLPEKIDAFKNKVLFRDLLKQMHPDFFYKKVKLDELDDINIHNIKMPFIIKPSVGFFSIGVYKVDSIAEWENVKIQLNSELYTIGDKYPVQVINTDTFIIEENIKGKEFAVDLYYDKDSNPVILNILEHIFPSGKDVNDRVYITSKEIIQEYSDLFSDFLVEIGKLMTLQRFPMHIEFRVDADKNIMPIEVNPMRFAGWCTTDIAYYAYGINVYKYFFEQKKPNWQEILDLKDKIYSIVIADVPKDIEPERIKKIDYAKFYSHFEKPLEMRRVNYLKYGVFAFLFAETRYENRQELDKILRSDLKEYLEFND